MYVNIEKEFCFSAIEIIKLSTNQFENQRHYYARTTFVGNKSHFATVNVSLERSL